MRFQDTLVNSKTDFLLLFQPRCQWWQTDTSYAEDFSASLLQAYRFAWAIFRNRRICSLKFSGYQRESGAYSASIFPRPDIEKTIVIIIRRYTGWADKENNWPSWSTMCHRICPESHSKVVPRHGMLFFVIVMIHIGYWWLIESFFPLISISSSTPLSMLK